MNTILSFLVSPALAALFGSLFQWLNRKEERAAAKDKMAHDEAMQKIQNDQQIALADKQIQGVVVQGQVDVEKEDAKSFGASQVVTSSFSDVLKSWARLVLVAYMAIVCMTLTVMVYRQIGGLESMDKASLVALFSESVNNFFYLFILGFCWFFGARGSAGSTAKKLATK